MRRGMLAAVVVLVSLHVAHADTVAWFKFDEGTGSTAYDSSSSPNNGTIHGAKWVTVGGRTGLYFDGTDDRVVVPPATKLHLTDAITIAAWVKRVQTGREDGIVGKAGSQPGGTVNFELNIDTQNKLNFQFWDGSWHKSFSTATITDTDWHHVAVTYDRTDVEFYIDGVSDSSTAHTAAMVPNSLEGLQIGEKQSSNPFDYLNGTISDLRLYNTALTDAQVYAVSGVPLPPAALMGLGLLGGLGLIRRLRRRKAA